MPYGSRNHRLRAMGGVPLDGPVRLARTGPVHDSNFVTGC